MEGQEDNQAMKKKKKFKNFISMYEGAKHVPRFEGYCIWFGSYKTSHTDDIRWGPIEINL